MNADRDLFGEQPACVGAQNQPKAQPTIAEFVARGQGVTSPCFKGVGKTPLTGIEPRVPGSIFDGDPVPGNFGSFSDHD